MRLILDTHILLWAVGDANGLSSRAKDLLLDPGNSFVVSTATLWEIAIKHSLDRGDMPIDAAQAADFSAQSGFTLLSVSPAHAIAVRRLPRNRHADPFDRLLVAQAMTEPMYLMTHDRKLADYGDYIMMV